MEWYWDKLNDKIFLNNWNIDPYEGVYLSIISLITPNSSEMIIPCQPHTIRHTVYLRTFLIRTFHLALVVIELQALYIQ